MTFIGIREQLERGMGQVSISKVTFMIGERPVTMPRSVFLQPGACRRWLVEKEDISEQMVSMTMGRLNAEVNLTDLLREYDRRRLQQSSIPISELATA